MAIKAGIFWHLGPKNLDQVHITFISHAKDRATLPDQKWRDNFEEYLPYRAELDSFLSQIEGKNYPSISLDIHLEQSDQEDLLQLYDLLLGTTQMALVVGSHHKVKVEFGRMVQRWCKDLKQSPGKQQLSLYRKFNLWAFPDKDGRPYNNLPLLLKDDSQLALLKRFVGISP
ncbi:MAG: hypothetical protein ACUVWV_09450 [Thermodesulfobacteriota bacterium]